MCGKGYGELLVDLKSGLILSNAILPALPTGTEMIARDKLHCTIMYDLSNPEIRASKNNKSYQCKIVGVEKLGKPDTRWHATVLLLESEEIKERFKDLSVLGFTHSFPDLKIHVSLVYGNNTNICFPIIEKLFQEGKLPQYITLTNETWSVIED